MLEPHDVSHVSPLRAFMHRDFLARVAYLGMSLVGLIFTPFAFATELFALTRRIDIFNEVRAPPPPAQPPRLRLTRTVLLTRRCCTPWCETPGAC